MKILCFHPALAPYRINLFNSLGEQCDFNLCLCKKNLLSQKFDQESLLNQLKIPVSWLPVGYTIFNRSIQFGISEKIKALKPDVVVTHEFSPITCAVAFNRLIRRSSFKHIIWSADYPEAIRNDSLGRKLMRRLLLPHAESLILYTEKIAAEYRSRFSFSGKIGISPNIQSESSFRKKLEDSLPIANKYYQSYSLSGKRLILYVGRLSPEKNLPALLHAFSQLLSGSDRRSLLLCIVGDGIQAEELKLLSQKLNLTPNIIFTSRLEGLDLTAHYQIADLFILPSKHEPYGAVVNEALLSGLPVICSESAGASTLIKESENGWIIDPSDLHSLTQCMKHWKDTSISNPLGKLNLRSSKMPVSFDDAVNEWLNACH
jgi:glycosyltransferase involved in cell wall biosynthesis